MSQGERGLLIVTGLLALFFACDLILAAPAASCGTYSQFNHWHKAAMAAAAAAVDWRSQPTKGEAMATVQIDYNKVREMLGTVVTDGQWEYVIADYKMGCDAYELWCKTRQQFYFTSYRALHELYTVISG